MHTPSLVSPVKIRAAFAAVILAGAALVSVSTAPAAITTSYPSAAYQLAAKYAGENPASDAKKSVDLEKEESFKTFLTSEGLKPAGKMAQAVAALVMSLRDAAKKADDEGIEIDPSKPAYRLVQQEAAAAALSVSVDVLGGHAAPIAPSSRGTLTPAEPAKPAKDPAPEVIAADQLEYDGLKLHERELSSEVDRYRKIVGEDSKASTEIKNAAKTKLTELEPALTENRAHQAWLRAKLTASTASKAATGSTNDDEKTKAALAAAAKKSQFDLELAKAAFDTLHAQLVVQRAAPADDQSTLVQLKTDESKLLDAIAKAEATIASTKASTEAADIAKNKEAIAKRDDSTNKLNANRAKQKLLRAQLVKQNADAANTVESTTETKAELAAATRNLETATASEAALNSKITKALPDTKANFANIQSYFHTGVTLLNPYHIKPADSTAAPPTKMSIERASSTDTNAFLEFVYSNRWAWNAQRIVNEFPNEPTRDDLELFNLTQYDVQARLGYTFASDGAKTANTLVGSGNFNGEVAFSKPLTVFRSIDGTNFSVGPEFVYGVVTDRSALKAHPKFFYGLGYTTSFKDPFLTTDISGNPRRVLLHFRAGQARIDSVKYIDDTTNKEIFSTNGDLPFFKKEWAGAFETELLYPIKTSTYVTFGSRVYTNVSPNPWSVQIGMTLSFGDLADGFFK